MPRAKASTSPQTDPAVHDYLRELQHPMKAEINALRELILGVSPDVREEIKWNAPSFRTTEHFATFNLRGKQGVRVILHTGAKAKAPAAKLDVADPDGLLEWLDKNRCMVTLASLDDIAAKRAALEAILREWIRYV